jgi:hypothetical protein
MTIASAICTRAITAPLGRSAIVDRTSPTAYTRDNWRTTFFDVLQSVTPIAVAQDGRTASAKSCMYRM